MKTLCGASRNVDDKAAMNDLAYSPLIYTGSDGDVVKLCIAYLVNI
jgi:hypothetical protein